MAKKAQVTGIADACITDATVPDVTKQFTQVVQTAIMVPLGNPVDPYCIWGLPSIFWGLSGIAKSARIKQASASANLACEVIMPGQKQPEDFSGIFVPSGDGKVSMECMLTQVRKLNKLKRGVLFVDEASCAVPATQSSMLGMVNDRIVADEQFASGIRVLLAANPPKYAASGFTLEAPFANRMAHFQLRPPSTMEWIEYMTGQGVHSSIDITVSEERLKSGWNSAFSYTAGLFCGFLKDRQTVLHAQPIPTNPQAGYNWPSPRTWEFATRAVATIKSLGLDPTLEQTFVEGCVGEGPASEFMNWVRNNDLPRPEQVLIKGWEPNTDRLDVTMAVTTSVTSYVVNITDKEEQLELAAAAWKFLKRVIDKGIPDIALPSAQTLVRAKLSRQSDKVKHKILNEAASHAILWLAEKGWMHYIQQDIDN